MDLLLNKGTWCDYEYCHSNPITPLVQKSYSSGLLCGRWLAKPAVGTFRRRRGPSMVLPSSWLMAMKAVTALLTPDWTLSSTIFFFTASSCLPTFTPSCISKERMAVRAASLWTVSLQAAAAVTVQYLYTPSTQQHSILRKLPAGGAHGLPCWRGHCRSKSTPTNMILNFFYTVCSCHSCCQAN